MKLGERIPLLERLMSKAMPEPNTGCWIWTGPVCQRGYGILKITLSPGRQSGRNAHRLLYKELVGPVPDHLVLDHLCRNTLCVNPAHLEVVTHRVNIIRGESPSAKNARATHCKRGHPYDAENTQIRNHDGARSCKTCRKASNRRAHERGRERNVQRQRRFREMYPERMKEYKRRHKEKKAVNRTVKRIAA